MSAIASVLGRRVWDSRGQPTVEVDVTLASGAHGRAIAPAGASRGLREAIDLRDGGEQLRGKGVGRAVDNVNGMIASALLGVDARDQVDIDQRLCELDDSPMKENIAWPAIWWKWRPGPNPTTSPSMASAVTSTGSGEKPSFH